MDKYLKVNIRQFDEGEEDLPNFVGDDGELNVEDLVNHYNNSQDSESEETETEEEDETHEPEEEDTEVEKDTEEQDPSSEEEPEPEKRTSDQAFADMRRKLEQNEPIAQWVQDLANQQGFKDPQELINAYNEQKLAREAEQKGVPVDVYQRLHQLEEENKRKTEEATSQQFNYEVESVKNKYGLKDTDIENTFQYMGENGYDAGDIPFEDAYVLANRDNLIQEAEERGRQSYLEEKQKQQQQATPDVGTDANDANKNEGLDYSKEGIFKTFNDMGIEID